MAEFLYAHAPLVVVIFLAVSFALIFVYTVLFALSLRPKKGTLEWIELYDRPGLQLSNSRNAIRWGTVVLALVAAILCAAVYILGICLQARSFSYLRDPQTLRLLLSGAAIVALTAAGGAALLQSLFGSTGLAFAGAMLLGLDLGADYAAAALLVWCLLFLHRWMAADFENKARSSFLPLVLLALMLSISATMALSLTPMVLVLILAVVITAVLRLKRTHRLDRFAGFFGSFALFFLTFLAGLVALQVLLSLRSGNVQALRTPELYLTALLSWLIPSGNAFSIPLINPAVNLPLIGLGLAGLAVSLHDARRYGKPYALILTVSAVGGLLTALFCGVYLSVTALIPAAVYTFARACKRGKPGLAAAGLIGAYVATLLYALALIHVI